MTMEQIHDKWREELKGKAAAEHRRYCRKSGLACLVYHIDGICPDVRDCEACKEEKV